MFFCNKSCQTKWRNQVYSGPRHHLWIDGGSMYREIMRRSDAKQICRLCKTKDTRILIVHHIDKNRKNNNIANLAWLCHNCHFLVHHHEDERKKFMVGVV
ncbi:HNH endonuclease [Candidatus Uhrbacteria bacterium]|nr:HNH endonuclease [Candidatus Uhrbacteria bacterium]